MLNQNQKLHLNRLYNEDVPVPKQIQLALVIICCCSLCTCHRSSTSFPVLASVFHSMLIDTQLYISLKNERTISLLSDCFESVHWWFTLNGLSLNPDKSEAIIIGTGARQRSEGFFEVIDLRNVHIQPSESVRSLGVVCCLSMHTLTLFTKQLIITPRLYVTSGKG